MRSIQAFTIAGLALCACVPAASAESEDAAFVTAWNERILHVAEAEDRFLTLKGVRATAMAHVAMHDALNSIVRRYRAFAFDESDDPGASAIAAAVQGAFEVAVHEYPGERALWESERQRWLASVPAGAAKSRGIGIGRSAAATILARREGDGWNGEAKYTWHPMAPGVYAEFADHSGTPEGFVFGSGWAAAKPFMLRSQDQFRVPPPPAIESDAYTRAYREVKSVGRYESEARTADQTHLALWWKEFVESSHNRLARELVAREHTGVWDAARLFALLNMSILDGYVSVFENKFHYNHWRPYTAIRWANNDGNPATVADPDWNNTHRHTYAFPSYPSAHGTACAAAMTVLADTYGDGYAFTMKIPEVDSAGPMSPKMKMQPATRSFARFSDAAMECSLSRVYLGIHFRYDSIEGNRLGRQVGEFAVANYLQPIVR